MIDQLPAQRKMPHMDSQDQKQLEKLRVLRLLNELDLDAVIANAQALKSGPLPEVAHINSDFPPLLDEEVVPETQDIRAEEARKAAGQWVQHFADNRKPCENYKLRTLEKKARGSCIDFSGEEATTLLDEPPQCIIGYLSGLYSWNDAVKKMVDSWNTEIVYENLPKYCKGCCEIRHEDKTCWRACKPGPHLQKEPDNSEEIQQGNQQGCNVGHPEICDKLGIYCPTDNDAHIIQQEKMAVPRVELVTRETQNLVLKSVETEDEPCWMDPLIEFIRDERLPISDEENCETKKQAAHNTLVASYQLSEQAVAKDRALKQRVDPYDSGMDVHQTEGHQRALNLVSRAISTANDLQLVVFDRVDPVVRAIARLRPLSGENPFTAGISTGSGKSSRKATSGRKFRIFFESNPGSNPVCEKASLEVPISSTINTVSGGVALLPYIPEFETQARGSLLSSPGIIRVSD
ncbi:hypothetical protein Dimus_035630 [Dionaea muscipula]